MYKIACKINIITKILQKQKFMQKFYNKTLIIWEILTYNIAPFGTTVTPPGDT